MIEDTFKWTLIMVLYKNYHPKNNLIRRISMAVLPYVSRSTEIIRETHLHNIIDPNEFKSLQD